MTLQRSVFLVVDILVAIATQQVLGQLVDPLLGSCFKCKDNYLCYTLGHNDCNPVGTEAYCNKDLTQEVINPILEFLGADPLEADEGCCRCLECQKVDDKCKCYSAQDCEKLGGVACAAGEKHYCHNGLCQCVAQNYCESASDCPCDQYSTSYCDKVNFNDVSGTCICTSSYFCRHNGDCSTSNSRLCSWGPGSDQQLFPGKPCCVQCGYYDGRATGHCTCNGNLILGCTDGDNGINESEGVSC